MISRYAAPFTVFCMATLFASTILNAQTNIPANTIVTQDFNSMNTGLTLPANWRVSAAGGGSTSTWATGATVVTQAANNGSPVNGGAYNWGTTAGTDRAVGFMASAAYATPNSVMAFYRNTTGATVTSLTISFTVERYKVNTSNTNLSFFSSTDGTAWTARTAGDISTGAFTPGAATFTFSLPQSFFRTVTITGLNILNNGDFYFRWVFNDAAAATAQGLGLDNVSIYAGVATPVILAQLRDSLSVDNGTPNQANPGDELRYTTKIKNIGSGDANNVVLTQPSPTNTTLVPGSVRTSALAKDESYITNINTPLSVAAGTGVLTNDFGIPSPTVATFGPSANSSANLAGVAGASDNGGVLTVNADGSFTYTPPSATFTGIDKFSYKATNGNAPDNDAIVTITVGTAPAPVADAYTVIGNVQISPVGAQNLFANDGGSGLSVIAVNGSAANVGSMFTTANGSNITVSANGDFIYNPGPGFDGPESFTYTIDNGFASPQTATVSITISGMVWFINAAAGAGDGRITSPFNSIAAYTAAAGANPPAVNDNIFIYENAAAYTGPITLLNGQKLIGQDATASLSVITGLTPAVYSTSFPAMNTGGSVTTIGSASNAVNLNSAAGTNLLRGFTVGNTTGSGISGTGFGTLTISDVSKNGTGQALALTTGAFGATATMDNITTTSSVNAVSLATITGTLTVTTGAISGATGTAFNVNGGTVSVTYSGNITQANNAAMVSISGGHASGTITFNTGTLSATNGTGLQFDNADGTYNFNGTTTLNGAGDEGIDILNGSGGTFTFGSNTSITSPSGISFNIGGTANTCAVTYNGNITHATAGTAMVNITNHSGGTVNFQAGALNATNGTGLQFDNADGTYNFNTTNGTTTLNGGDAGIDILNGSAGGFTFASTTSITNPTGSVININTSTGGNVTYSGTFTKNSSGIGIAVNAKTGGTVTINGTGTKTLTTSTSNAISLTGNAGATINFSGNNLLLTTTSGIGLNATGGATAINVTGTGNIISAGSGAAVNIVSSTIGVNDITFRSISAGTGVGSAGVGITLNNTGTDGGLHITGDGTTTAFGNGSGGTIQHKTGADAANLQTAPTTGVGILLINTFDVQLSNMILNDFDNHAIFGTGVNGITFNYGTISGVIGTSSGTNDAPIALGLVEGVALGSGTNGLTGTSLFNSLNISGGIEHNFEIYQTNGSGIVTIQNCSIHDNTVASGSDGLLIETFGSTTGTINVTGTSFTNNKSQAVQLNALRQSNVTLTLSSNTVTRGTQGNEGFVISNGGDADLNTTISNNTISGFGGVSIFVGQGPGNASSLSTLTVNISSNLVTAPATATNHAIIAFLSSTVGQTSVANILIDANTVTQNSTTGVARGILVDDPDTNTQPAYCATVTNNIVHIMDNVAGVGGLVCQKRRTGTGTFDVRSNTVDYPNGNPGVNGIRVRQVAPGTCQLEQGAAAGTAAARLAANNPTSTTEVLGTVTVVANNICN